MKRRTWIISTIVVSAAVAGFATWIFSDPLHARARREWAARAIATIERRADDKSWLDRELPRLKEAAAVNQWGGAWVGDELLVAADGEWMICQNVCTKEEHTPLRRDLFIGRGSDDKWYYSTFHFCVGKCVLQMEPQPATLAQLVDGYYMVPFDGTPAHCLEQTWTGQPWGQAKAAGPDTPLAPMASP